ncbi:M23 family metallopeptidase [Sphingomonas immobilis]|uniref:M23 family metallopeptidase n=1 Tax=Sphingomonas immobilis TaxID=3063997 RepID=A0ABT9A3H2_9SPHN|nr:M23 family metallopeptidase [Sphingomonas sp. CA1-15]MDO7844391.1 M23 family metallopeptidase [Sphingomonas sp. CA1-15]
MLLILVAGALGGCIPQTDRPDPYYNPQYDRPQADRRDDPRYDPRYDRRDEYPQQDRADDRRDYRDPADDQYERPRYDDGVSALPAPPPAWRAQPVTPDAQSVDATSYTVRAGDMLRQVAERTGAGSEAIARANDLPPPFTIRPGQRLTIPAGRYHLVRAGQTGIAIARAYGIDWHRIVDANDLVEPYTLRVGMRVLIPGDASTPATPRTAAERAAAFRLDIDDILTGGEPALATNQRTTPAFTTPRRALPSTAAITAPSRLRGGFEWPVQGRVVAHFGPGNASGEKYNGIKIAVPKNTPILAAADGTVAYVGSEVPNLGGVVILKHGDNWNSVYGHASQLLVQRGQAVKRGQTIALSGETGLATQPEVHFELRKGRTPVDPLGQLPR